MRSVNKATLLGRIGKDPEIKSTGGGTLVANVSLATDDRRKDAQGNWQNETTWHNLVAFGKTAEIFRDYIRKGAKMYVEGKIQLQQWESNGQKHNKTVIIVDVISMLDDKPKDGQQSETRNEPPARTSAYQQPDTSNEISDSDLPF